MVGYSHCYLGLHPGFFSSKDIYHSRVGSGFPDQPKQNPKCLNDSKSERQRQKVIKICLNDYNGQAEVRSRELRVFPKERDPPQGPEPSPAAS